ncbi:hypothetical protein N7492_002617 [Penicillium capsulatum]|uniref:F-box domain-containing protein n=1 Tax=Penicillium capsulatum TaxID=69766 RepID=A0A9W9LWL6_9EURO|nr:hypothetical protein N7492_002617 [Penicillium capsulatum]KAJ6122782.1 hypothetical protein N7512_005247 [Penicillium capsulatum]
MAAPLTLESLPFDVFYQIATLLDDRDYVHLSRTSRAIQALMASEPIAHKIVTNNLQYSKEGQFAMAHGGYSEAIKHRFAIHDALATGAPYSVSVLAHVAEYVYHRGFLCYRIEHEIRLLDVHHGADTERVLDLRDVLPRLAPRIGHCTTEDVEILHYSDGIVALQVSQTFRDEVTLLAIDMSHHAEKAKQDCLLLETSVPGTGYDPVFVRHTRSYLWYGGFTATDGSEGIWRFRGIDLATQEFIEFTLDLILPGDLGHSLCFEMYDEHLYAVSTQDLSEEEPFSSFYYWFCYAPRNKATKGRGRIWRREHNEGPINENWNKLSICIDEVTGQPVILECRREWPGGNSENHRTNYIHPLPLPEEALARSIESAPASAWAEHDLKEETDSYPYSMRPGKRIRRYYHAEHEAEEDPFERKEYIAAQTKYHSYHLAAGTFIDLVKECPSNPQAFNRRYRLHIRTVSRKRTCPIDEEGSEGPSGLLFRATQADANGMAIPGSEERFVSRGVHLWPAEDAPLELHRLLCPMRDVNWVRTDSDDRSLMYTITYPETPLDHRALVLISFDPKIRFSTLTSLPTGEVPVVSEPVVPVHAPRPRGGSVSLIREGEAFHKTIRRGYWLR